jgi:TonB family protein
MNSTHPWTLILSLLLTLGLFNAFFSLMPGRASGHMKSAIAVRIQTAPGTIPVRQKIQTERPLPKKRFVSHVGQLKGAKGNNPSAKRRGPLMKKNTPPDGNERDAENIAPRLLTTRSSNEVARSLPNPAETEDAQGRGIPVPIDGDPSSTEGSRDESASGEGAGPGGTAGEGVLIPSPSPPQPSGSKAALLASFQDMVSLKLNRAKTYPREARERKEEGTVILSFLVETSGCPSTPCAISSSGFSSLDQAAIAAVASASPFLPFPSGFPDGIRVKANVRFYLSGMKGEYK